jgi:hypothetical protein
MLVGGRGGEHLVQLVGGQVPRQVLGGRSAAALPRVVATAAAQLRHQHRVNVLDTQVVDRISVAYPGSGAFFLTPGDRGRVNNQDPGFGMNNPDYISESLETMFWVKIFRDGKTQLIMLAGCIKGR